MSSALSQDSWAKAAIDSTLSDNRIEPWNYFGQPTTHPGPKSLTDPVPDPNPKPDSPKPGPDPEPTPTT